jgi:hypothetical protein
MFGSIPTIPSKKGIKMKIKIDETRTKLVNIKVQLRAEENIYIDPMSFRFEIANLHTALRHVINTMLDVLDEVQNGKA